MDRIAIVAGATGVVGLELVKLLLENQSYTKITVLVRRRMALTHPRLDQQVIDFDQLSELPQGYMAGADVYCTLGSTMKQAGSKEQFERVDYAYPMALGRLAKRDGARSMLIVTAIGASEQSSFFYSRVKGKVESGLRALGLPRLHIFRPSLIIGKRHEKRFGERVAIGLTKRCSFLFVGVLRGYKPNEAKSIALAMLHVAIDEQNAPLLLTSQDIASWGA